MTARAARERGLALLGCAVAAALVLLADGRGWATVVARTSIGGSTFAQHRSSLTGGQLAPVAAALGWVGLAAVVAVPAARGRLRSLLGALLAMAGVAIAVASLSATGHAAVLRAARSQAGTAVTGAESTTVSVSAWPVVAAVAGILLALAGLLVAARGAAWTSMSARYESPAARRDAAEPADPAAAGSAGEGGPPGAAPPAPGVAAWDALDRGEDPTG